MSETLERLSPGIWKILHRLSYLDHKHALSRDKFNDMAEEIVGYIPCDRCISKSNDHHIKTKHDDNVFEAWWNHHNNVNSIKNKAHFGYKEAMRKARRRATNGEIPGLEHVLFNTENGQLERIINKLLY